MLQALPAGLASRDRRRHGRADAARAPARRARRGLARRPARAHCCWRRRRRRAQRGRRRSPAAPCAIGAETRETLRIEQGVPRFGVDFDGSSLPAEAGIVERAVSFTKGCYIGQEPIVRLAHRGHANRELHRLRLDDAARAARDAARRRARGRARDERRRLPEGGAAALGYVRRTVADGAPLVALDARGERVAARDAGRVAAGRP